MIGHIFRNQRSQRVFRVANYNFNHHEPKAPTAKVKPKSECAFCQIASAKTDVIWTPFYPLQDK